MNLPVAWGLWRPYGQPARTEQALDFVYPEQPILGHLRVNLITRVWEGVQMVGAIAIAMFVALAGWGGRYFGWDDEGGKVQLALITSFILGIIGGFKAKG
jgi:hypothetical protein